VRIIAGQWRGRALKAPEGEATRPTADRVREALFSMLTSRLGSFEDLRVLDLFSGTGALGLEALSRGAGHVIFVEANRIALDALKANITGLGAGDRTTVLAQPAETLGRAAQPCDLLLLDPPYGSGLAGPALVRAVEQGWVAPHAMVSIETGKGEAVLIPGFTAATPRAHGKAWLHLLRADGQT
jgi:16S rRNA (guanine966-N2)-methyltransferase